jgi:hypothetical protein
MGKNLTLNRILKNPWLQPVAATFMAQLVESKVPAQPVPMLLIGNGHQIGVLQQPVNAHVSPQARASQWIVDLDR